MLDPTTYAKGDPITLVAAVAAAMVIVALALLRIVGVDVGIGGFPGKRQASEPAQRDVSDNRVRSPATGIDKPASQEGNNILDTLTARR